MEMEMAINTEETATPLRWVADLNAHIKVIVEVSRAMNMTATDAMLTAKQVGERSRGFAGAAGQMQRFTPLLDHSMDELLSHISRLVLEISTLSQDDRALQYIEAAREMSLANRTLRGLAARRREEGAQHAQEGVREGWIALGHELHHAFLPLQSALKLARSANLEPVFCGEMATGLKRAVAEIDAMTQRVMADISEFGADAGAR